jgi:O-antigen/teichoic acid export membrane protein
MANVEPIQLQEKFSGAAQPAVDGVKVAKNTAFNFAGQVLPVVAGIALIPYIIKGLGPDRFGMLGIIWVVFGYFSLMDLGLGRATTKFLAEWLAKGKTAQISEMVWSSIFLQVLLGLLGGAIIATITPFLVGRVLKTPIGLEGEAHRAFYILAATLPVILAGNGFRAVLEGCERFDITNLLRIPSSALAFVIPAVAISFGLRLPGVVLWMGISRVLFTFAHGWYCTRILPHLKSRPVLRSSTVRPLLVFGGWVTASNVVNPILLSMDRFLIGSIVSVAMVGYYTAPFEAVTKLWMIPVSLMTTVYPICSALGPEKVADLQILYSRSIKYIFCAIAPIAVMLVLFARPLIGVWLGAAFVSKSAVPLQLLAIGVLVNSFAHIPYCFLQALGRPDAAAKLFLCELLPYGLLLWLMIQSHGIDGAAAAWLIRVAVEVIILLLISWRVISLSPIVDRRMGKALLALCFMGVAAYATRSLVRGAIAVDAGLCLVWMSGFAFAVWKWVLDNADRASLIGALGSLLGPARKRFEGIEESNAF